MNTFEFRLPKESLTTFLPGLNHGNHLLTPTEVRIKTDS